MYLFVAIGRFLRTFCADNLPGKKQDSAARFLVNSVIS